MAWYHGTQLPRFNLHAEQMPLPPRHAFNPSDGMIARLSTFFRRLMRLGYLVGTKHFFDTLLLATNPTMVSKRRLIRNCHILYRKFTPDDYIILPQLTKKSPKDAKGKEIGVMKLAHFLHSKKDRGVVLVRQYADSSMSEEANPHLVWDLIRRPAGTESCQSCSNRKVSHAMPCSLSTCSSYLPSARALIRCWRARAQGERVSRNTNGCGVNVCKYVPQGVRAPAPAGGKKRKADAPEEKEVLSLLALLSRSFFLYRYLLLARSLPRSLIYHVE